MCFQYRVSSISENTEEQTYSISGSLYDKSKYDLIERGYKLWEQPYDREPSRSRAVPAPTNVTVMMADSTGAYGSSDAIPTTAKTATISWDTPVSAERDKTHTLGGFCGTGGQDEAISTLNENLTAIDTTITVSDGTNFASSGIILIDDEFIKYTGKSSNDLTGCTRGAYNSKAAAHTKDRTAAGGDTYQVPVFKAVEIAYKNISKYEVDIRNILEELSDDVYPSVQVARRSSVAIQDSTWNEILRDGTRKFFQERFKDSHYL